VIDQARTVARADLDDAVRSKLLWGAAALLLVVSVPGYLSVAGALLEQPTRGVRYFPQALANYVAPVALIAAHRAVVGERESGTLRLLFGHPVTRGDIVSGKLLGRAALVGGVLSLACIGLGVATFAHYGTLPVLPFLAITAYIVFYGVVWTAIVVGVSAAAATRFRAIAAGLALFMVFGPFQIWQSVVIPLFTLLFTGSTSAGIDQLDPNTWPVWYEYVLRLNPIENFVQSRYAVVSLVEQGSVRDPTMFLFGVLAMVLWAAVPLAVGYWRFQRSDLG